MLREVSWNIGDTKQKARYPRKKDRVWGSRSGLKDEGLGIGPVGLSDQVQGDQGLRMYRGFGGDLGSWVSG